MTTLQQKQDYLRESVLTPGYDPILFKELMESKRPGQDLDLDAWTFQDLRQLVNQFRAREDQKHYKKEAEPEGPLKFQFVQERDCIQDGSRLLLSSIFSIKITGYQKIKGGGLFANDFIVYNLSTHGLNFRVKRRYNDFVWLKETLQKLYPSHIVAGLPPKGFLRSFQKSFVSRRMKLLELFMSRLIKQKDFNNSVMEVFLREENMQAFEKFKNTPLSLPKDNKLEGVRSARGRVVLEINDKSQEFYKRADQMFRGQQSCLSRLQQNSQLITKSFKDIGQQFGNMLIIAKQMSRNLRAYNKESPREQQNQILQCVYGAFEEQLGLFTKMFQWDFDSFQQHMINFIQSEQSVNQEVLRKLQFRKLKRAKFLDLNQKVKHLKQTSDKHAEEKDRSLKDLRQHFAYLNATLKQQLILFNERAAEAYCNNFKEMANEHIRQVSERQMALLDTSMTYDGLLSGNRLLKIRDIPNEQQGGVQL